MVILAGFIITANRFKRLNIYKKNIYTRVHLFNPKSSVND